MEKTSDETIRGWAPLLDQLKAQDRLKSDTALADQLGVTRGFISAVRCGRKNISPELGETIFKRLGMDITAEYLPLFKPFRIQRDLAMRRLRPSIRLRVLKRAAGKCELCGCSAPFLTLDGEPYLEIHHLTQHGTGSAYSAENSVALCPNCHRKVEVRPSEVDTATLLSKART